MTNFKDEKVDFEAAEREMIEALHAEDPFAALTPVDATIAKNRTSFVAFRLRSDEFQELERAAANEGVKLSEFMRQAALSRARSGEGLPTLTPALATTLDELTKQYQEMQRSRSPRRRRSSKGKVKA